MKVQLNKKLTKLKIVISGTDAMQIRDDISGMLSVKVSIRNANALRIGILSDVFAKHLNTMHFEREVNIILTITQAAAFYQIFSESCDPVYQFLCLQISNNLCKNGILLP